MNYRIQHYGYTPYKDDIERIYTNSFPLSERFDFSVLKKCDKEKNVHLSVILGDDTPVGMQFTVGLPNDITYLMYYAIAEDFRGKGIGSKVLQNLVVSANRVMLSIEKPVDTLTQRRKEFYQRNGFVETGVFFEDTGVHYEVLCSDKGYKPTEQDLLNRYRFMTGDRVLWDKIKSSFNTASI